MKHLVKRGKKILGFVYQDAKQQWWYAFGRPSQSDYMAFACNSMEQGIAKIEMYQPIDHAIDKAFLEWSIKHCR